MEVDSLRAEIESLNVRYAELARRLREVEEYVDVVTSPLWKRVLWWLQGWRFDRVGRWRKP